MRLPILKTPKVYIGGAFVRSESARTFPSTDAAGNFFAHIPLCSRKDVRNAVEVAAKAGAGWAKRTPYNRAQILYRLAEMMESRRNELTDVIVHIVGAEGYKNTTVSKETSTLMLAQQEVELTIDRIIHYAGWADKYEQLLGSVNPVSSSHFNFTVTEPVGVVGVVVSHHMPLLSFMSMVLPVITAGNSAVVVVAQKYSYIATLLGEMLATSDLPGGVVNILTGTSKELLPTLATHEQIRCVFAAVKPEDQKIIQLGAAESVKRTIFLKDTAHFSGNGLSLIQQFTEAKTTWHPIGT